jgi:hypothetical protein
MSIWVLAISSYVALLEKDLVSGATGQWWYKQGVRARNCAPVKRACGEAGAEVHADGW